MFLFFNIHQTFNVPCCPKFLSINVSLAQIIICIKFTLDRNLYKVHLILHLAVKDLHVSHVG